ncbi:MAG: ABC transporter permease [Cyclobacteriaceae bacterium]
MIIPFALLGIMLVFVVFESSWRPDQSRLRNSQELYNTDPLLLQEIECQQRRELHLDWPVFYFSITPYALPANFREICSAQDRQLLKALCLHNGNTEGALSFLNSLKKAKSREYSAQLEMTAGMTEIEDIEKSIAGHNELRSVLESYKASDKSYRIYIPRIGFSSSKNQFHDWLIDISRFDFGKSTFDNQDIATKVNRAFSNTVVYTLPCVFIVFILAIYLGRYLSANTGLPNSIVSNFLYFLDAIPPFWLAIVLMLGAASAGFGYSSLSFGSTSYWEMVYQYSLPMLTLVLTLLPYVTKQVQASIEKTLAQPFIKTARTKGLAESEVFRRHVLRNASLPVVTLLFDYLAYAFAGAFVIELVFSIPGIGQLMADAVLTNDIQVISAVILYLIFIKMALMLLSDVAKYFLNPSIKF